MKRRAPLVVILVGVALAGFMAYGLAQVAGRGPELGGPVVVSHTANSGGTPATTPERTATPGTTPPETPTPTPTASPSKRKTKAEPVKPPSPRPGGDDDDDGGDDDGGDDDD
ncbi:hypothetical protein [Nonomuraea sp. SBT364]|uniref:hypothetical protein n=1 Tax=Nonomuraea sp. SBT364 TaxID=1580530 RepID=UPI0012E1A6AB|nr:hypothetical protein [Nonomuraea sp. SBT364]